MRTITLSIPDIIDIDTQDIEILFAISLYERHKLSLGQAAEVAGLSERTFMELLGKHKVSVFDLTSVQLTNDIDNA